jgi:hypothetical protein
MSRLKRDYRILWDELKELEAQETGLGDSGHKLAMILRATNADLDTVRLTKLLLHVREMVRREAGLKV